MSVVTTRARPCGDEDVSAGRGPGQREWYQWAASNVLGHSVLDAGCGLGYGLDILTAQGHDVRGQDMDPRLESTRVHIGPLSDFKEGSVDTVVSIDVVEHIEDDRGFVEALARIARRRVILTTPNWTAGRSVWPYHVREYTPRQLRTLCTPHGDVDLWKGTPDGSEAYPIRFPRLNDLLNDLRVRPVSAQPIRLLNAMLAKQAKIHSHLAAVITLL